MTAESVHADNPGSHLFSAGDISLVLRMPTAQEWDLYVDMRGKKSLDARKLLRSCVLYPPKDELLRLIERKPALARKLDDLVMGLVAPNSGELVDSNKHAGAQMLVCDGTAYHLRQPTESDYERLEDGARNSYSTAATHFVKACLLEPGALELDQANARKPGMKHVLAAHLTRMAGADLEFTEKK